MFLEHHPFSLFTIRWITTIWSKYANSTIWNWNFNNDWVDILKIFSKFISFCSSQPPPTYATTVSSMASAAANSTPFDAFLCNWYPLFGAGGSDLVGNLLHKYGCWNTGKSSSAVLTDHLLLGSFVRVCFNWWFVL